MQVKHQNFRTFFIRFHGDILQYNITQDFVLSKIFKILYTLLYILRLYSNTTQQQQQQHDWDS